MLILSVLIAIVAIGYLAFGRWRRQQHDVTPPEAFIDMVPRPRVVQPKKRGRTTEEVKQDQERYIRELRENAAASFQQSRARAQHIDSKFYIWRSSKDSDVCDVCRAREGERFRWTAKPPHGHPGECTACPSGYCRCWPETVIPF